MRDVPALASSALKGKEPSLWITGKMEVLYYKSLNKENKN